MLPRWRCEMAEEKGREVLVTSPQNANLRGGRMGCLIPPADTELAAYCPPNTTVPSCTSAQTVSFQPQPGTAGQ